MPSGDEWVAHLPWIKQWVAMRKRLGATCLNCEWDFHMEAGRKPWAVLVKACSDHLHLTPDAPAPHADTTH